MATLCNSCEQQESCKTAQNNNIKITNCERYFQTRRETVRVKQTNADRIRQMTDEELAEIISSLGNCDTCYLYLNRGCNINTSCKDAVLEWLRKDADLKIIRKTEENADTFQQN